ATTASDVGRSATSCGWGSTGSAGGVGGSGIHDGSGGVPIETHGPSRSPCPRCTAASPGVTQSSASGAPRWQISCPVGHSSSACVLSPTSVPHPATTTATIKILYIRSLAPRPVVQRACLIALEREEACEHLCVCPRQR